MAADQRIEFRQVRSVTDVINATFHFIRQNYKLLGKSLLFIVGPPLAVSSTLAGFFQTRMISFSLLDPESLIIAQWGEFLGIIGLMIVTTLFSMLLAVLVVLGFVMLYEEHGPDGFEVADVWQKTKDHFWQMFGTMATVWLLMMLPIPIIIVPCLGFLAYMAWLVYAGVVFSLAYPMRMQESVGISEALGRARKLVQEDFWPTFGVLLLASILYYLISIAFSMPASILSFVYVMNSADGGTTDFAFQSMMVASSVISGIASTLLYCIPLLALAFQYFNLVERKERVGLLQRIDQINEV